MAYKKLTRREKIHKRIRQKIFGTSQRPRLAVYKSLKHIYAQAIDDTAHRTILSFSSISREARERIKSGGNVISAREIGLMLADKLKEKGINKIVFDRGGFKYHGRIKALAEALREKGIEF